MKRCWNCSLWASTGVSTFRATLRPSRGVLGAVDDGHAAAADHRLDPVARELEARLVVRHRAPPRPRTQPTGSPHHPQNWCCAARRPPQEVQNRGGRLLGRPRCCPRVAGRGPCRSRAHAAAGARPPRARRLPRTVRARRRGRSPRRRRGGGVGRAPLAPLPRRRGAAQVRRGAARSRAAPVRAGRAGRLAPSGGAARARPTRRRRPGAGTGTGGPRRPAAAPAARAAPARPGTPPPGRRSPR